MTRHYKKACGVFEIEAFYVGEPMFIDIYYGGEKVCIRGDYPVRPDLESLNDLIYLIEGLKRHAHE